MAHYRKLTDMRLEIRSSSTNHWLQQKIITLVFLCETLKQYQILPQELRETKPIQRFIKRCKEFLHSSKNCQ